MITRQKNAIACWLRRQGLWKEEVRKAGALVKAWLPAAITRRTPRQADKPLVLARQTKHVDEFDQEAVSGAGH